MCLSRKREVEINPLYTNWTVATLGGDGPMLQNESIDPKQKSSRSIASGGLSLPTARSQLTVRDRSPGAPKFWAKSAQISGTGLGLVSQVCLPPREKVGRLTNICTIIGCDLGG